MSDYIPLSSFETCFHSSLLFIVFQSYKYITPDMDSIGMSSVTHLNANCWFPCLSTNLINFLLFEVIDSE